MRLNCASCGAGLGQERRSARAGDGLCDACRAVTTAPLGVSPQVSPSEAPISLRDVEIGSSDLDWSEPPPVSVRSSGSGAADFSHADLDALAAICPPPAASEPPARSSPPRRQDGRIDFEAIFGTEASRSSLPMTPRAPHVLDRPAIPPAPVDVGARPPPPPAPVDVGARPPPPPARASIPDFVAEDAEAEERGPSSGLRDLRKMSVAPPPPDERIDRELIYLSGGLFDGGVGLAPPPTISPLDLPKRTAPPPPPRRSVRAARDAGSMAPTAVTSAPEERRSNAPHVVATNSAAPTSRGGRRGLVIFGLVAAAAALVVVGKLGVIPRASATSSTAGEARHVAAVETTPVEAPSPLAGSSESASAAATATASATATATATGTGTGTVAATGTVPVTATVTVPVTATGTVTATVPVTATGAVPGTATPTPPPAAAPITPPSEPRPAVAPPADASGAPEFDPGAAKRALAQGAANAHGCRGPDDPSGVARLTIIFAPSGRVTSARIAGPPFQGTPAGSCIAQRFQGLRVPAFSGTPVSITKEVTIE